MGSSIALVPVSGEVIVRESLKCHGSDHGLKSASVVENYYSNITYYNLSNVHV